MSAYRGGKVIECPVCGVPHVVGAAICDSCRQPLNVPPDWDALETEYRNRKANMILAGFAIAVMIAFNVIVCSSAGGFVVVTAPIGWFAWNWVRAAALKSALTRHRAASGPSAR